MVTNLDAIYTEKQQEIYKRCVSSDWFILINHGAKRSGKTVLNNDLFIQELIRVRKIADEEGIAKPMYILSGATLGTIQNNILNELTNKYGITFSFDKHNNFTLFGVYVIQAGHSTIAHLDKIRGMTAHGAYVNEASLANEEVFDEIKSRCSGEGARVLADTNPADPEHWLLKDYIQNPDPQILSYSFGLDDNTFLSERYKNNMKNSTPTGMFYDRNIKGLWVSGDGVVYSDFNKDIHFKSREQTEGIEMVAYFAGVDWGYSHYGSIVVIGEDADKNYYVIEEHAAQFEEIDYWVLVAKGIKERYGHINFYCDSARPEHVVRFRRERIRALNANKSILAGVEEVARLIKLNRFFVVYEIANRFREEIYKYIWDEKSGLPKKENDDVLDSIRYAILSHTKPERRKDKKTVR